MKNVEQAGLNTYVHAHRAPELHKFIPPVPLSFLFRLSGMAYAALANLPAIYGLYASTIAGCVGREGGRGGGEGGEGGSRGGETRDEKEACVIG